MTKITLKKASAIQLSIPAIMQTIDVGSQVEVGVFTDALLQVNMAKEKFTKNINRTTLLIRVQHNIRKAVGEMNAKFGINDLLADIAHEGKMIVIYSNLSLATAQDLQSAKGRLEKMSTSDTMYARESLPVSLFNQAEIDEYSLKAKNSKRSRDAMKDKLLYLNMKHTITLSEEDVVLLKEEGLL